MENFSRLPAEFVKPILPCLSLLKNCNIHFFDDRNCCRSMLPYFYILPSVVGYHAALTIYFIEGYKRGMELDELFYVVPVLVVSTQSIFKALIVVCNSAKIRSIILNMGRIWKVDNLTDVQITKKNVLLKRLKFCYAAFYWMNIIGSWQYILTPLLKTVIRRYILQQDCGLMLPFGCYFPFDTNTNWGIYIMAYLFEGYSMFRIIYYYLGSEFLMITLCSHLGTEFTLLQEDILRLDPSKHRNIDTFDDTHERANFGTNVDQKVCVRDLIKRHQILIALAQDLDNVFNKMIFVNLSSASISICFFGFSAKVASDVISLINNFVAVVALMLPIYNLCYYGELLKEASQGIAHAAYTSKWHQGSKSYKKALCFMIMRSQKPCTLTSFKYNPIALSTFTTVMSTTWSYFSLASSLYDETVEPKT